MSKEKNLFCSFLIIITLVSCSTVVRMTGSKMNKLELGMSKEQVIDILGDGYTIAEKRAEEGSIVEVLSYRDFYKDDEFYMFEFANNKLKKWYREIVPKYELTK